MKFDTINQEGIKKLMDIFYAKVRKDKDLSPIFNTAIGTDEQSWTKHKEKIASFWMGMFLGEGGYNGSPLKAHHDLPPFPREFFDIWLKLFDESLEEIFEDEARNIILERAKMIAQRFQIIIYEHKFA
ncbi:Group 3 truncated hemoglobin ctb [Campylobacter insulaenigrae]|uniref:group III truncated hemoglobin n=1 Tax=Campylobacter insulaenigrae TaxID=260714 RepID=UPI000F6E5E6A|nr:group III truncated hemoglobin [Campylobacter insulaenigrae]MCR6591922.1 group III truncated hemoglobin [Campylobacter insulaenigrae]MCR6593409.1 group III truncated hemoglobin [Campylobacter insulaenigrae]VEJ52490.1 Group 3 truncated hemoglobin ctb [Campylobacter insulaenigrae]